ncbi:SOS response-associated peptidase [Martelella mediterranea]|uniref:Abasic site processing protein n=1 Tax=Martelella mediterranea TaxID=293089 RepID=A0A4V2V3C5_9HYPH|nr:SOS response-associated peptidase [Martelella mediterranea]TCT31450.1 putative SOS response-associated peptidase YedK [Martelella mediterranea]
MCGRFGLITSPDLLKDFFELSGIDHFPPRFNIAPSQPVMMVVNASDAVGGGQGRKLLLVRWGLLPSWLKDGKDFPLLFNARSETAAEKATFRGSMRHFRALVPASGFFEWRKGRDGAQPYWVQPRGGGLMAFAGLISPWMGADGTEVDTGTILTTKASGVLRQVHERAPVIIAPENFERWLECRYQEPRHVSDLLKPQSDDFFEAWPVSKAVNNVRNMDASLIEPAGPALQVNIPNHENKSQLDLF